MLCKFREELIDALIKDYDISIAAKNTEYAERLKQKGCKMLDVCLSRRGTNPLKDIKYYKQLKRYARSEKPDLILTFNVKPNVYGGMIAQKLKIPYIANITGLGSGFQGNAIKRFIVSTLYKKGLKKCNLVFFQNEENLNAFKKQKLIADNYQLINGSGVNLKKFSYSKYPDDSGGIKILFLGRVMSEKGAGEYLQAAQYYAQNEKVKFFVAGDVEDKDYEEKLKKLQEQGVIDYLGFVENSKKLIEEMHLIVLPSYHEGMANVLLEAAACGRPVIATNMAGCKEAVIDGKSGYLINKQDAVDLVEKLNAFLGLPHIKKIEMGKAGRQHIEQNFNREKIVEVYKQNIEKILRREDV